ncbi:MAG TPA: phosphatidylserine/phosphatidylglycerophosphate/cardiolipin synthase family protein [Candidatus Dormibacteraeota bacterium]|nr:phosphatidylserine/phosphatidylglycerophosphate/cardiolipin synthase family protein [Candidatus Dormibacteraeota bacterium]
MVRVACLLFLLLSLVGCSNPASSVESRVAYAAGRAAAEGVELWQDAHIFDLVDDLIFGARLRVLVEMYEIGRPGIIHALAAAAARGVDVRVVTDPTVKQSRAALSEFEVLGVPVRVYPVDDRRHQIDHVKLLIADAEAVVGGMNWGRKSDRNHDYVLETRRASDVRWVTGVFEQDWLLAGGHPAPLTGSAPYVAQTSPGEGIRVMLETALNRATRFALAEVYTLTDPEVIAELVMAHQRGVMVRVVLDPNQSYNMHSAAVLLAGGVEVRWYPVPRGVLLHAKIGLFDAELVLGSANWTLSGLGVNHEVDIETGDSHAVAAYESRFEMDWARSTR